MAYTRPQQGRQNCWCPPCACPIMIDPVCDTPIQVTQKESNGDAGGNKGTTRQYVFPSAQGPPIQITETMGQGGKQDGDNPAQVRVCIPGWMTCTQQADKAEPQVELGPGLMAEPMPQGGGFYLRQSPPPYQPYQGSQPNHSPRSPRTMNDSGYRPTTGSLPSLGQGNAPKPPESAFRVLVSPVGAAQSDDGDEKPSHVYVVHRRYQAPNGGFPGRSLSPPMVQRQPYIPSSASSPGPDLLTPTWRPRGTSPADGGYGAPMQRRCCQGNRANPVNAVVSDIEVWGENQSFDAMHEMIHPVPVPMPVPRSVSPCTYCPSYVQQGPGYPSPGVGYSAPGSAYQSSGSPYQSSGSPYQSSGSPYQSSGSPYQTTGSPYQSSGSPYQSSGSPYQSSGSPYQSPGNGRPYNAMPSPEIKVTYCNSSSYCAYNGYSPMQPQY